MRKKTWFSRSNNLEYYYNPFFDSHSFYCPDRKSLVLFPKENEMPENCENHQYNEDFCVFCLSRTKEMTPEKVRISKKNNALLKISHPNLLPTRHDEYVLFRRHANLFEILNFNYWQNKYNFSIPSEDLAKIDQIFNDPTQKEVYYNLLKVKLLKLGHKIENFSINEQKNMCQYFLYGFHDLITSGSHFIQKTNENSILFHSGLIKSDEHIALFQLSCDTIQEYQDKNPHITFVAIFQNWLNYAGATFAHWHKQILGLDFWGRPLEREATLYKENTNIYKDFALKIASDEKLFIAENTHAVAYAEIGTKNGHVVICSKSKHLRPQEHSFEEISDMSNLTHAILQVMGTKTPYNEEWIYTPFDAGKFRTPWRIVINPRTFLTAGLENITQISINPISIKSLADLFRKRLQENKKNIDSKIVIYTDDDKPSPNLLYLN